VVTAVNKIYTLTGLYFWGGHGRHQLNSIWFDLFKKLVPNLFFQFSLQSENLFIVDGDLIFVLSGKVLWVVPWQPPGIKRVKIYYVLSRSIFR